MNKTVPLASFPCKDVQTISPHYVNADRLWWWDGYEYDEPGWYCSLCVFGKPGFEKKWTLLDELYERPRLISLVVDVEEAIRTGRVVKKN